MKLSELPQSDQSMITRYCKALNNFGYNNGKGERILSLSHVSARIEGTFKTLLDKAEKLGEYRSRVNAMLKQNIRGIGTDMPKAIELQLAIYVDECEKINDDLSMLYSLYVILQEIDTVVLQPA
jgi:hypothetical protein